MGKRYYCDYCDKSFADNPLNRQKHLTGVIHQRLRKLHYSLFREPEEILAEESAKPPCVKLRQAGFCSFEGSCRFSHLTPERRRELLEKIEAKKNAERAATDVAASQPEPTLDDWLAKRAKKRKTETGKAATSSSSISEGEHLQGVASLFHNIEFKLPVELQHIPDLPPSLIPPSHDDLRQTTEWGL